MTKRFTYNVNKNCIECDGKFVAYLNSVDGFRIANKLTVLAKENEQLKHRLSISEKANFVTALEKENEQLKKALWCIRKRYGYTIEEFVEDFKGNGIDLTKVDLE